VLVGEGCHPDKVKVYGPGVEKTGLKANEPTYFTVDCGEAGQGEHVLRDGVCGFKNSSLHENDECFIMWMLNKI